MDRSRGRTIEPPSRRGEALSVARSTSSELGTVQIGTTLIFLLSTSGCILALKPARLLRGVELPEDLKAHVSAGMTERKIVELLGEPRSRRAKLQVVTLEYLE